MFKYKVVIGDSNGQIQIYNSSPLSLVNSFQAHSNYIRRIKQSPFNTNTNYVATCSLDKTVKIWNVSSSFDWTLIRTYSQHSSQVYALEWLDNDTLASAGYSDRTIKLWSIATGQTKRTIKTNQWVFSLTMLNTNIHLAAGLDYPNYDINIFNINDGNLVSSLKGHTDGVMDLVQISDNLLASSSSDETVRIWNLTTNTCKFILTGHTNEVRGLKQITSNILASGSWDSTADFESLYTNLDPPKTIELICGYLNSINFKNEHINLYGIKTFLLIIFNKNIFSYENNFYIQLIGIAMGCKCGPSVANLCLYIQEINWVRLNKPIIYQRFIDDIVYLKKNGLDKNDLISQFDNLKLNFISAKKVQFLDLNIEIDNIRNKLKFSLFTKPTNTFQYLHKNSNHPKHIFNNIPKSLFIRIRRNCSDDTDYYYYSGILLLQLKERGYDFDFLFKILCQIGRLDRVNLIKYKEKRSENET
jgi:hypothetical protein